MSKKPKAVPAAAETPPAAAPAETPPATLDQARQTAQAKHVAFAYADIADLLAKCVFPGSEARRVATAINWLEAMAGAAKGAAAQMKADEKRARKALKLKPKEEKPHGEGAEAVPGNPEE